MRDILYIANPFDGLMNNGVLLSYIKFVHYIKFIHWIYSQRVNDLIVYFWISIIDSMLLTRNKMFFFIITCFDEAVSINLFLFVFLFVSINPLVLRHY